MRHRFYKYAKGSGIGFISMPLGLALLLVERTGAALGMQGDPECRRVCIENAGGSAFVLPKEFLNAGGSASGMRGGLHWECEGVCIGNAGVAV